MAAKSNMNQPSVGWFLFSSRHLLLPISSTDPGIQRAQAKEVHQMRL
jgi:hypothetical protein